MDMLAKVKELAAAPTICPEAKEAAEKYIAAYGTADQAAAAAALKKELEEDVGDIDGAIAFFGSESGAKVLGADNAASMLAAAKEAKTKGERYCICPACQAGEPFWTTRRSCKSFSTSVNNC